MKRSLTLTLCLVFLAAACARAEVSVTKVDFLESLDLGVNAAGPLLVQMDVERNRLIVANTLTSSISIIDCSTNSVTNIPLEGRALQHLKSECMTYRRSTGDIFLIGTRCIYAVFPEKNESKTIHTREQFESIAVDEETGNVFVTGRESGDIGFIQAGSGKLQKKKWLEHSEALINLNQTPPPPIRKVICDSGLGRVIAVDGFTSTLHLYDTKKIRPVSSRPIGVTSGGRWHLAGYDDEEHYLYIVVETDKRRVIEAVRIDIDNGNDVIVPLPEYTEGVGVIFNPARKEVYIPYDNHQSVHVVTFEDEGKLDEIAIPTFGNDASAIDTDKNLLYIGSWARGEVDVVDLGTRRLLRRITGLGIIPHMFTMAFNPRNATLYFPKGATAVNGTFGAAVTSLDPATGKTGKIHLGWSPIDLIERTGHGSFLVFNSEDQFAEVSPDGALDYYGLPFDYPVQAVHSPEDNIYLSYGPHQSYWPTVYIWGAKNGVLTIDSEDLGFYDRRIPRQAHEMILDRSGLLYFTQNNWGKEKQFLGVLRDQVRLYEAGDRVTIEDEVEREITQRILEYDPAMNLIYLVKIGEKDDEPGAFQAVDPGSKSLARSITLGLTPTDLVFDDKKIYIANFDSRSVSVIDKASYAVSEIETDEQPLKLCSCGGRVFVITHAGNTLQEITGGGGRHKMPHEGLPDNIFTWNGSPVITVHTSVALYILRFDTEREKFTLLHEEEYPYGDTRFDTANVSFYVRGQYGDTVFEITKGTEDGEGRLWVTDFLSGKLFILSETGD